MIGAAITLLTWSAGAIALASIAHSTRAAVKAWRALMETRPEARAFEESTMAKPFYERPCAARGLHSYRFAHAFGFVMIGAVDDAAAMIEARRSTEAAGTLQRWNGNAYVPCDDREGATA